MYVKGVLDVATGSFSSITEGSGLTGNFDISVHNGISACFRLKKSLVEHGAQVKNLRLFCV
jgi:hypothetical protein